MKRIFFALLLAPMLSQAAVLGTTNAWTAQQDTHEVFGDAACTVFSPLGTSKLELYTLMGSDRKYMEPGVLVYVKEFSQTFRGVLGDGKVKFNLVPITTSDAAAGVALTVRAADRKAVLKFLKETSYIEVKLYDSMGRMFKLLNFGASGFSKSYDKIKATCAFPDPLDY